MKKITPIEFVWFSIAIICLVAGIHKTIVQDIGQGYIYFIFVVVALLMFFLRKYLRKTLEKDK